MSEQPTLDAAAQRLQERFNMPQEQKLLALNLRNDLRQLHSTERVISGLQSVMAGAISVAQLLEEQRSLLGSSKEALHHTINKYKRQQALPASVCDEMLKQLEDIGNE